VVLLSSLLPGCPMSDNYFVETSPGAGGASSGSGGSAGAGDSGGTVGGGAVGGTDSGGGSDVGGSSASGGSDVGGSSASGGSDAGAGGTAGSAGCVAELERCDGISNDCDNDIDEDSACPEGCSGLDYDGHAYVLCVASSAASGLAWDDASSRCRELGLDFGPDAGLDLAWIESADENDVLKSWIDDTVSDSAVVWIGASDRNEENTWLWIRGQETEQFFVGDSDGGGTPYMDAFNDWSPGSPRSLNGEDQDCGGFDTGLSLHWDDRACESSERGFICEEFPTEAGGSGGRSGGGGSEGWNDSGGSGGRGR